MGGAQGDGRGAGAAAAAAALSASWSVTRRPCNVETTTIPPNQRKSDAPPCERRRNKQYPAPSPRKSDARASVATTTSPRSPRRKTQLIIMLSKRIGKLLEAAYKSRLRAVAVVVGELQLAYNRPVRSRLAQVRLRARVARITIRRVRVADLIMFR